METTPIGGEMKVIRQKQFRLICISFVKTNHVSKNKYLYIVFVPIPFNVKHKGFSFNLSSVCMSDVEIENEPVGGGVWPKMSF